MSIFISITAEAANSVRDFIAALYYSPSPKQPLAVRERHWGTNAVAQRWCFELHKGLQQLPLNDLIEAPGPDTQSETWLLARAGGC